jgi:ABC-type multidrug transport system ATPase subunit
MQLMRRLADQGRTIILITHATKNVMLADKVIFLARGGYLAWFGPPEEALEYFDNFRSERDARAGKIEFDEIYAILDDPGKGKAEDWANRYREPGVSGISWSRWKAKCQPRRPRCGNRNRPQIGRRASQDPTGLRAETIHGSFGRNIKILTRDRLPWD